MNTAHEFNRKSGNFVQNTDGTILNMNSWWTGEYILLYTLCLTHSLWWSEDQHRLRGKQSEPCTVYKLAKLRDSRLNTCILFIKSNFYSANFFCVPFRASSRPHIRFMLVVQWQKDGRRRGHSYAKHACHQKLWTTQKTRSQWNKSGDMWLLRFPINKFVILWKFISEKLMAWWSLMRHQNFVITIDGHAHNGHQNWICNRRKIINAQHIHIHNYEYYFMCRKCISHWMDAANAYL